MLWFEEVLFLVACLFIGVSCRDFIYKDRPSPIETVSGRVRHHSQSSLGRLHGSSDLIMTSELKQGSKVTVVV